MSLLLLLLNIHIYEGDGFYAFAAFSTPTGMPYGTVNLVSGIPSGETTVTCTAGVGTFIVEFGSLSQFTGDPVFMNVAVRALEALWQTRSQLGLVGVRYYLISSNVFWVL